MLRQQRSSLRLLLPLGACILLTGCAGTRWENQPPAPQPQLQPERNARAGSAEGGPGNMSGKYASSYVVRGKRYRVLKSSKGYSDWGYASWYGDAFDGRPTASGEIYDMNAMTAANKVLPLPTWVRVTDLVTHRSVVVKVNDRGPFHPGRIIDLSHAAAKKLGIIGKGSDLVMVEAINNGTSNDAPDGRRTNSGANGLYLQVGAFHSGRNARQLLQRLTALGLADGFIAHPDDSKHTYNVRLGPYSSNRARQKAAAKLERNEIHTISINQ